MKKGSFFDLDRFMALFRNDALRSWKPWLITFAGTAGLLLLIALTWANDGDDDLIDFHPIAFAICYILGGLVFTSSRFPELGTRERRHRYLSLPVSGFEKFFSKWLLTTVVYTLSAICAYLLVSWIINALAKGIWGAKINPFNPFSMETWKAVFIFYTIHPVYFLGACIFNRRAFIKTSLVYILIQVVMGALLVLFGYLFLKEVGFENLKNISYNPFELWGDERYTGWSWDLVRLISYVILPLGLWAAAYFHLKDKEV